MLKALSPNRTCRINRFGDLPWDLDRKIKPIDCVVQIKRNFGALNGSQLFRFGDSCLQKQF
ncbi:MAG: hypothetical protein ACRERX_07840 [Pseudomonas sp.]